MVVRDSSKPTVIPGGSIANILQNSRAITLTGEERADSNAQSTSSFFYDPPTLGLKSTQQLNVDWSQFANHTFFGSAEVNVNVSFDQVINNFPFDGSRKELEVFFEKLTGFEKYVYDRFPKNVGYLFFSGTVANEDTNGTKGTWIAVNDYAGGQLPSLSKNNTGQSVLDPGQGSFTIELQLFLPQVSNGTQVICQKMSGSTQGFSLFVSASTSTVSCSVQLNIVSGTNYISTSTPVVKGQFNHITAMFNRLQGENVLQIYVNEALAVQSQTSQNLGAFDIKPMPFIIGSGSALKLQNTVITPNQTLSGAIDEFRFFHSARTQTQINRFARKNVFASDDLKLYFKFNEPTGTIGANAQDAINRVVLDGSGNSLHSYISPAGFNFKLRSTGSIPVPVTYEKLSLSPILFPSHPSVVALNVNLLSSASLYDQKNPNIITKLIPQHYFLEGQASDGQGTVEGNLGDSYNGTSIPGSGQLGTTQLLLSFLYVWAKFFDEMKLYIDAFSTVQFVDYNSTNTAPDHFLPLVMKQFGFTMPPMFVDSSIEQFIDADNVQPVISTDTFSLQYIQNQILRRVLSNINEIIKSKGTQHSVKAFLRTVGIDPDNSFRIREFGGPTKQQLLHARETKLEPGLFLDFGSGGFISSSFLSASRVEPGYPGIAGTFVPQSNNTYISSNANDGLLTSGSWTYEAVYKWPLTRGVTSFTESLARIVTGGGSNGQGLLFNVVAMTSSIPGDKNTPSVRLYGRPTIGDDLSQAPLLFLHLDNVNIFDGNRWNISFGRDRNDSMGSNVSSSYFLRAATQDYGEIKHLFVTQSFFSTKGTSFLSSSMLQNTSSLWNASGAKIAIGSASIPAGTSNANFPFLNNTVLVPNEARGNAMNGQVARVRFWTKALDMIEWTEHVKNYKSLGVHDPSANFNFVTAKSGSWERLRADVSMDQDARITSANGDILLFDYSQNQLHFTGSNFPVASSVISVTLWPYSFISPAFDEASSNDKVRVRSFQNYDLVTDSPYAQVAPIYQINPSESPTDDVRFSIEFSIMDALNRDIISIFATLEALDNALGNPELMFSPDYPTLENLRDIYFNRLTEKINIKSFFEFYRWFDSSIGSFIEQLIPRKTKFFGTNFVIESHMLERPKFEYSFSDIYLADTDRHPQKETILLQLIDGTSAKKY